MTNYNWNSDLSRYEYSHQSYTGPHTKSAHRHLSSEELENIKVRQLELISDSLNKILNQEVENIKVRQLELISESLNKILVLFSASGSNV